MQDHEKFGSRSRKTILYIALSLDGYIAKPGDDLSFLEMAAREGEDYGYVDFVHSVDTVIMGRKTYDWVMTQVPDYPHEDLDSYIITRSKKPAKGKITFYTGSLKNLIATLKGTAGKDIFIDGGAEIVNELLKDSLIDEFILTVFPVFLGSGVRLFQDGRPEQKLTLIRSTPYDNGILQLQYSKTD